MQHFNMDRGKALMTPLLSYVKLIKLDFPQFDEKKDEMDKLPYALACGSLMYAMIDTRPNMAFTMGVVSKCMSNPSKKHWEPMKGIMRYLNGTRKLCIFFRRNRACILGYTNADYARDMDKGDLPQAMSSFLLEVLFLGNLVC